jgi:tetratricopeptide (TPR) repeat protein
MADRTIKCFLISAFDEKPLLRKPLDLKVKHDFEQLFFEIKQIVQEYQKYRPEIEIIVDRANTDVKAIVGDILYQFYQKLHSYDLVVAEISSISPNVYFELGVRLTLRTSGTILLAMKDTDIPFDILTLDRIVYSPGHLREQSTKIYDHINNILENKRDSPIYLYLPDLEVISKANNPYQKEIEALKERFDRVNLDTDAGRKYEQVRAILSGEFTTRDNLLKALALLQEAHQRAPNNFQIAVYYGKFLSEIEDYNEAIRVLSESIRLADELGKIKKAEAHRERALAYRRRASKYNNEQDFAHAVKDYRAALRIDESDDESWARLGSLYRRQDRITKAIYCYQKGLTANSQSTSCLVNELLLRTLSIKLNPNGCTADFVARSSTLRDRSGELLGAVSLETKEYWPVLNRAEVDLLVENGDEALAYYTRAAELSTTPAQLQGPIDNLTFIAKLHAFPGTHDAIALLEKRHQELKLG